MIRMFCIACVRRLVGGEKKRREVYFGTPYDPKGNKFARAFPSELKRRNRREA